MFHSYWNVIGFDGKTKDGAEVLNNLIQNTISDPTRSHTLYVDDVEYKEYQKEIIKGAGIVVFGYFNADDFIVENVYPYVDSDNSCLFDCQNVSIEQMSDKFAYLGMFDSYIMNMVVIFYLKDNRFINSTASNLNVDISSCSICLSALSSNGIILFPVDNKNVSEKTKRVRLDRRISLLERAKHGDEEAIDTLTIDEMETQQMLYHRIRKEDVLSIVESYFMPDGLENDKYAILGDILDVRKETNPITGQEIYCLQILCNDVKITVMINQKDLTGEPKIGRRFRGKIWLLGEIKDIDKVKF